MKVFWDLWISWILKLVLIVSSQQMQRHVRFDSHRCLWAFSSTFYRPEVCVSLIDDSSRYLYLIHDESEVFDLFKDLKKDVEKQQRNLSR